MARAPFALNANTAADIAPVELQGGFNQINTPDPVSGLLNIAETKVAPFLVKEHEKKLSSDIKEDFQSVTDALQLARNPSLSKTYFNKQALENPVIKNTLQEFNMIRDAVAQNRLPSEYALDRYNSILSDAVARNPAFEQELRAAAQDALGFNPKARFMAQLMSPTPEQQTARQLQVQAAKMGITVEELQNYNYQMAAMDLRLKQGQLRKQSGQFTAGEIAQEAGVRATMATASVLEGALTQLQSGGITNPDQLLAQIDTIYAAEVAALTSSLPPGVDPATVNGHVTTLEKQRELYKSMISNGDMSKILTTHNKILKEQTLSNLNETLPEMFTLYTIGGHELLTKALGMLEKFKGKPEVLRNYMRNTTGGSELSGVLNIAKVLTAGKKVFSGEKKVEGNYDKRVGALFSGMVLGTGGQKDDTYAAALDKLIELAGGSAAWNAITNADVVYNVANHKNLHQSVINIYQSEVGALTAEYSRLQQSGELELWGVKIVDNTLTITNKGSVSPKGASPYDSSSYSIPSVEVNVFVENFNRIMSGAEKYKRVGVFNDTIYGGAASVYKGIVDTVSGSESPPAPTTTGEQVWDFDENGNLVRVQ